MHHGIAAGFLALFGCASQAQSQLVPVSPQIHVKSEMDGKVTQIEVAAHFVTTIRMPEAINSVVVGDPSLFDVEHSEREPQLVFVKVLTTKPAETNLLISTVRGHEASLWLISRGEGEAPEVKVDFLLKYGSRGGFFIEQVSFPTVLVGETASLAAGGTEPSVLSAQKPPAQEQVAKQNNLDRLLDRQREAALPQLFGAQINLEDKPGDRIRAGVGEVIDGGQRVIVLFSVVNPTKHAVLLLPPQVQLGGKVQKGKLVKHSERTSAEQLPVLDYRLSHRRLGPGERADGVVVFERPPYKQSSETLFLQVAEAGAVNRPALAPIGFGVSSMGEDDQGGR